ncbi:MAG: outer membrane beta-barrel protein, partial [Flavobacteriales bacterium]
MRKATIAILLLIVGIQGFSQDSKFPQTLSAGVEFRPIFPIDFLKTGSQGISNGDYSVTVTPKFSFSAGMIVRYGFHKRFALETGLSFVQRNYNLDIHRDETPISPVVSSPEHDSKTDFTIVGYEHPIKLLVFVRLAERFYMNAAAGMNLTFFPSDIFTSDEGENDSEQFFQHSALRLGFDGEPGTD